mgnify:FL=1
MPKTKRTTEGKVNKKNRALELKAALNKQNISVDTLGKNVAEFGTKFLGGPEQTGSKSFLNQEPKPIKQPDKKFTVRVDNVTNINGSIKITFTCHRNQKENLNISIYNLKKKQNLTAATGILLQGTNKDNKGSLVASLSITGTPEDLYTVEGLI